MSKESRQRARENARRPAGSAGTPRPTASAGAGEPTASATAPAPTTTARTSTGPSGSARSGRRERSRPVQKASPIERYRSLLVGAAVVVVVALVGIGLFSAATTPTYACSNAWIPDPTASPGPSASPQPGYPQPDMGTEHVSGGTAVTYTYCPPASGRHYTQTSPIAARLYGPDDNAGPTGWTHNLEHGAIVVLYRGDSEGATEAGQATLRNFYDTYPPSPMCGLEPGANGPVIARFDDMATPFAALVWGRVLPLETFDAQAIIAFDQAYGEKTAPEKACDPSAAPSASPSASASASEAPSAPVAPSATPVPSADPSALPSPS